MTSVRLTSNREWLRPELSDVIRLFLGDVPISADEGEMALTHTEMEDAEGYTESCALGDVLFARRAAREDGELAQKRAIKRAAKNAAFEVMKSVFGIQPPWGSLTGIRPTRLMYEALEKGMTLDEAQAWLEKEFFVSHDKSALLKEILLMQRGLVQAPEDSFDLYIHIPFCVSRCAYCSFASGEVGDGKLTEPYVEALLKEMEYSARLMREEGLRLRAAYMGGGTPTALSSAQLDRILFRAGELFGKAREWTVEAGRPDTIDREKLETLKKWGVERISVNPQSFSDETLKRIGRAHSAQDTLRAYALAREMGFHHINMDLIAALPGEDIGDFARTIDKVTELRPESVTVHSLAIKRASRLHEELSVAGSAHNQASVLGADEMITLARRRLSEGGWRPYYLYRQKYMAGNLENVGYALPGYACLYNIGNMEETARVLAVGAGSITKWLFDRQRRIERAPNLRNIEQYIQRVDEMCLRKRKVIFEED